MISSKVFFIFVAIAVATIDCKPRVKNYAMFGSKQSFWESITEIENNINCDLEFTPETVDNECVVQKTRICWKKVNGSDFLKETKLFFLEHFKTYENCPTQRSSLGEKDNLDEKIETQDEKIKTQDEIEDEFYEILHKVKLTNEMVDNECFAKKIRAIWDIIHGFNNLKEAKFSYLDHYNHFCPSSSCSISDENCRESMGVFLRGVHYLEDKMC